MAQCNSGGFIDDLRDTNPSHPSIILTACTRSQESQMADDLRPDATDALENENEYSTIWYHNEFDYHVLSAMTGHTIVGNTVDMLDYSSLAGITPVSGIHAYEYEHDSYRTKPPAQHGYTPVFDDPLGIGSTTLINVHMDLASFNESKSSSVTSSNNQRKLLHELSGKLHEVFEGGGGVFYR
jgi:hypothetical protein